ncbi:MAG: LysR family transcriptional regulator [Candidatus Howiella sp.]|jgi:DNA-binding transcriptional LysR family regulator
MNLQQLEFAVEIAKAKSITKAAKNLYLSQPNLSKSIKELEQEIGISLFTRTAKGVVPTEQGEAFLEYARSILEQMRQLAGLYTGDPASSQTLYVAVPRASYVSEAFSRYTGTLSRPLDVRYKETSALTALGDVASGDAHLGIVRFQEAHADYFENLCRQQGLAISVLWNYAMMVLMDARHPLAGEEPLSFHALTRYPEIVHGSLTPVLPPDAGPSPTPEHASNKIAVFDRGSQFDILRHVEGSYMWVSPMPPEVLRRQEMLARRCDSATRYYDVLVHHAARPLTDVEKGFISALREEIRSLPQT